MTETNLPANVAIAEIPPMPFGFTLERVYRILRDHLKLFLGLAAPPAVAMILLYAVMFGVMFGQLRPLLTTNSSPVAAAAVQLKMMQIMFPSILVAMVPMTVVIAFYLAAAFLAGNKIDSGIGTSVRECFGEAWARLGRSLGLLLWIYFRAFGPLLAIEVVFFGVSGWLGLNGSLQNPPIEAFWVLPLIWLLFVAAYVYGVIIALRMCLAFPAMIEEELTAGDAIRRSGYLTHRSKGRIFLLLLVVDLIACACVFVLEIVVGVVFAIGAFVIWAVVQAHPASAWMIVGILAAVVAGLALLILFYVWMALLYASLVVTLSVVYHDQRRRKDPPVPTQLPRAGAELPPGAEPA